MDYKFRAKVKIKKAIGKILRPDGSASQAEFFEGSDGIVLRHDPQKGGYLIVLNCPEVSAAMGETITAYFSEYELEPLDQSPEEQAHNAGINAGLPFEYPAESQITGYAAIRAKNNKAKRLGDA